MHIFTYLLLRIFVLNIFFFSFIDYFQVYWKIKILKLILNKKTLKNYLLR